MKKIKNISAVTLSVRGLGEFGPGEIMDVDDALAAQLLHCAAFELGVETMAEPEPRKRSFYARKEEEKKEDIE